MCTCTDMSYGGRRIITKQEVDYRIERFLTVFSFSGNDYIKRMKFLFRENSPLTCNEKVKIFLEATFGWS
jgi:hypothetical protein